MTVIFFDVWLDTSKVTPDTLPALKAGLSADFKLPTEHVDRLLDGASHCLKRACDAAQANEIAKRFERWGVAVRLEPTENANVGANSVPQPAGSTTMTLAPAGAPIPSLARDQTPPDVSTEHLHVID